jgi:hypothetical protein
MIVMEAAPGDLDELSTEELRQRAFSLAVRRRDIAFFWSIFKHLPHADDAEALDASLGAVGALGERRRRAVAGVHRAWTTAEPSRCCGRPSCRT